jgi:uncharacterized protein YgbK (DUF1537 family)
MTDRAPVTPPTVTVLADDLSGAAETARVFLGRQVPLNLHLDTAAPLHLPGVTVVDLNTRSIGAADAHQILRAALAGVPADSLLIKKVDSLLRGHVGAEVGVLAERGPVVVAAALPVLRRTVHRGVLRVAGIPLHQSNAWVAEHAEPPHTVAELFDRMTAEIPADDTVADALRKAAANGQIAICDAETNADLDRIVAASRSIDGAQLVGTSALAAAVARTLPPGTHDELQPQPPSALLTVVGTADPMAAQQVSRLVAHGFRHMTFDVDALLNGTPDPAQLAGALARGPVVVTVGGDVTPVRARALPAALGRFISAGQADHRPDLVLTGGETARAVIDAIGLTSLRPVHEVHHGAVVCVASDGRHVVTRPGSFGDPNSLGTIAGFLTGATTVHPQPKDIS